MTRAYYNEHDEFAADWLRSLIKAGLIADGEVDMRSIVDVRPSDLAGFGQCHFFAGIGGWSYALRQAGWADSSPVWTGSCPCQPFSLAGAQRGFADERHLWPVWRELIRQCGPAIVFGEQVASATDWLGLVRGDLEEMGRAVGAMPVQAASAGADHLRDRYWFVADADSIGRDQIYPDAGGRSERGGAEQGSGLGSARHGSGLADAYQPGAREERQQRSREFCGAGCDPEPCVGDLGFSNSGGRAPRQQASKATRHGDPAIAAGCDDLGDTIGTRTGRHGGGGRSSEGASSGEGHSDGCCSDPSQPSDPALDWVIGADGKARRVKPGIRLLAHGVPNRVGKLRGFGNAIDPRPAAAFIEAYVTARRGVSLPQAHQNPEGVDK